MPTLNELVKGPAWQPNCMELPIVIGREPSGRDVVVDLVPRRHLLIAGDSGPATTAQLKAILTGLLMARTPEKLRLLLIGPKPETFSSFTGLPYMLDGYTSVIPDAQGAIASLKWAIAEMERRYKTCARAGVRTIKSYNDLCTRNHQVMGPVGNNECPPSEAIPYIVVVINELGEILASSREEMEHVLIRLAQLGGGVGINIIVTTQQVSEDLISENIKMFFESRIVFQLRNKDDSISILNTSDAESLVDPGEMLFVQKKGEPAIRIHSATVSDEEIRALVGSAHQAAEHAGLGKVSQRS